MVLNLHYTLLDVSLCPPSHAIRDRLCGSCVASPVGSCSTTLNSCTLADDIVCVPVSTLCNGSWCHDGVISANPQSEMFVGFHFAILQTHNFANEPQRGDCLAVNLAGIRYASEVTRHNNAERERAVRVPCAMPNGHLSFKLYVVERQRRRRRRRRMRQKRIRARVARAHEYNAQLMLILRNANRRQRCVLAFCAKLRSRRVSSNIIHRSLAGADRI